MTRLHEFSTRLLASSDLDDLLDEVLDAVIGLQGADFGNIQLYNPKTRALEIVTQRGFSSEFLEHFSRVEEGEAACGRALARGDRVVIEDVELDPGFASHRRIAATAGFRAVQSTPLFSRSGEPLGMISTHFRRPHRPSERDLQLTDLHARQASEMIERKRAEEALRQSEAQFRLLGEAIPQQVWSHLPDGSINYCNQRWTDYSGLTREETRDGWVRCLHPEDRERVMKAWNEALARSTPYEGELRIRGADGGYRRFLSRAVPVRDERGHVVQWFGTNTDLEERKQAEEALHRAQTEIARFARLTTRGRADRFARSRAEPAARRRRHQRQAPACAGWTARIPSSARR